jgi:hypothetical protein
MLIFPQNPSYGQIFLGARRTWVYREGFWDVADESSSGTSYESIAKKSITIGPISPEGLVDGINKQYTIQHTPISNTLQLYYNGLLQKKGESYDYLESERLITFNDPPHINSTITVVYERVSYIEILGEVPRLDNCHCAGDLPKYKLEYTPDSSTIKLYLNGLLKKINEDYEIEGNSIIFTYEFPPEYFIVQVYYRVNL